MGFLYVLIEVLALIGVPVYTFMSGGSETDITHNFVLWYAFTAGLPSLVWIFIYAIQKNNKKIEEQERLDKSGGTEIVSVVLLDKTEQMKEKSEMVHSIGGHSTGSYLHTRQVSDGYLYRFLIVYQNGYRDTISVTDKDERLNDLLAQAKCPQ